MRYRGVSLGPLGGSPFRLWSRAGCPTPIFPPPSSPPPGDYRASLGHPAGASRFAVRHFLMAVHTVLQQGNVCNSITAWGKSPVPFRPFSDCPSRAFAPDFYYQLIKPGKTGMDQTVSSISTHGGTAALAVVGLLALIVAFKMVKFILKLFFGFIALGMLIGAA